MIPKQAIEKAIEGGWQRKSVIEWYSWVDETGIEHLPLFGIALDPTFWQALGKALGWEQEAKLKLAPENIEVFVWMMKAHEFYDLILTQQDTGAFWDDLLK